MTSLLHSSQILGSSLEQARIANVTRSQIAAIQNLQNEWSSKKNKAATLFEKAAWFDESLVADTDLQTKNAAVKRLVQDVVSVLRSNDNVQEVSKDNLWTRLLSQAENAATVLDTLIRTEWAKRVANAGTFETPERIGSVMPKTPKNTFTLQNYRQTYASFTALKSKGTPGSIQDLEEIDRLAAVLVANYKELVLDMPDEVRTFQQALVVGNAGLNLLTPTVVEWLQKNDDPERFVISINLDYVPKT